LEFLLLQGKAKKRDGHKGRIFLVPFLKEFYTAFLDGFAFFPARADTNNTIALKYTYVFTF